MISYLHTTESSWIKRASDKLSAQQSIDARIVYIKEKMLEHLTYITKTKDQHYLALAILDDNIMGISCYTLHPNYVKIDFVYKTCDLPHIGRLLVANIMSTTKSPIIKIDNIAGDAGYKCYTSAANLSNYIVQPHEKNNICLTFTTSS
jgi:hypothetical protein